MAEKNTFRVVTRDAAVFEVNEVIFQLSEPLTTQWEAINDDEEPEDMRVELDGPVFARVLEWANLHLSAENKLVNINTAPHPIVPGSYTHNRMTEDDEKWVKSLDVPDELLAVIHAADTLAIKPLLSLLTLRLTFEVRGKTPAELQELFQQSDEETMSPEEIAEHCVTHNWAVKIVTGETDDTGDSEDGDAEDGVAGGAGGAGGDPTK